MKDKRYPAWLYWWVIISAAAGLLMMMGMHDPIYALLGVFEGIVLYAIFVLPWVWLNIEHRKRTAAEWLEYTNRPWFGEKVFLLTGAIGLGLTKRWTRQALLETGHIKKAVEKKTGWQLP